MEVPSTAPPPVSAPSSHLNYPESVESSPRSRNTDSWDESMPPAAAAAAASAKLRFMCSYGGHIVPRPHDKSLCYVGGETRIVVVERHTSLADLSSRLSNTFLNGRPFTLKYLLPTEDLDSLISVTTNEDLDNMIDEYDRISNSSLKPSRIRLFLFPVKPDSAQSIPVISSSAKSEDWFLGMLNRGFSDSGSVNLLMGFDDEVGAGNLDGGSKDVEAVGSGSFGNGKSGKQQGQDVHSVPDSPMLETTSSFGSTSSSPSVANLPPIRVHVDDGSGGGARAQDQKAVGIEDQLAQMGIGGGQKQDEGFLMSSPSTLPASTVPAAGVPIGSSVLSGEYQNRVVSDDERSERSDHGVLGGYRKPPTAQQQTVPQPQILQSQLQQKQTGGVDLPSPDSVSSDSSLTNAMSRSKPMVYQDQAQLQIPSGATRVPSNPVDPKLTVSDSHGRIQMQQQVLEQGYVLQQQFEQQQQQQFEQQQQQQFEQQQQQQFEQQQQQQFEQQQQQQQKQQQHQFIHGMQQQVQEAGYVLQQQFEQQQQQRQQPLQQQHQFIHGAQQQVQEAGYVLQPQFEQQQQQFIHGTHFIHHAPSQAMPLPPFYPAYHSQQQLHPQHHHQLEQQYQVYYVPTRQTQHYNLSAQQSNISEPATTIPSSRAQTTPNPAAYNPIRNASVPKSEMTAGAYRTAISVTPQVVQVASGQPQQQFVTYSQYQHSSQAVAANSAAPASYAYEYADPAHAQIYFSQPLAPTMTSQYQTMTGAAAAEPSSDSMKQQIRTSQPQ